LEIQAIQIPPASLFVGLGFDETLGSPALSFPRSVEFLSRPDPEFLPFFLAYIPY
jgi:hypothetical protein